MSDIALRVQGLGKQYQIGVRERSYTNFREALAGFGSAPWRRFKRLAGQTRGAEQFWAIRGLSFDVHEGEVVGVIGRNGAGKSTLLKILSQITEPTEGEVELHGRAGSLLEVGTGFHPELTGRENIYLNGAILGMKRAEIDRRFDEIVAFSEIESFLDTPVKRYSSGMYTRLAFSVAAHLEPDIMIVDEVLAVGDTAFQEKCLGKMNQVSRSGRTVLFVSHNLAAVESLCTRGIVLDGGGMVFDGKSVEAVRFYGDKIRPGGNAARYEGRAETDGSSRRQIRILSARVDAEGETEGNFAIGAPLVFSVELETAQAIQAPAVGIGINNQKGMRVATLHTKCDPKLKAGPWPAAKFQAVCTVPSLALAPGSYSVYLAIAEDDKIVEEVEKAFHFTVLATDFFQNAGKYVGGIVFCQQQWRIEKWDEPG